ncbi:MAG: flavocytochrome c [Clostridiales bacterium]|nr:flavocytochrome c [Clostridiales bacterium]
MALLLSLLMMLTLCLPAAGFAAAGVYEGSGDSLIGGVDAITVQVTLDEADAIIGIEVILNNDTPGISDPAIAGIPAAIVEYQSIEVDAIAGATMTSDAIVAAVEAALVAAGVNVDNYKVEVVKEVVKEADVEMEADVVIIGAGGAGLAAAVTAHQNGASVIVLEKLNKVGGNTILAGGALNAVDDRSEVAVANDDSVEWHYTQTMNGGDNEGDTLLVHTLVSNAWDGVQWLKELGMGFQEGTFTVTGGMWPRAHKPSDPVGTGFFKTYMNYIDNNENIEVMLNTTADEITVDADGRIGGVIATGETGNTIAVKANNGVIVATGGFAKNVEMRVEHNTIWADLGESVLSTNHTGATGDGIVMAEAVGANLVQMGNIQLLPLGDPVTGSLSGNIEQDVEKRIFINKEGNRFVDEGERRDVMTSALFEQTDNYMWIVVDSHSYPTGDVKNNFNESADELVAAGRAVKGETIEELAENMGVPVENLVAAVEDFNAHVETKEADAFGRTLYSEKLDMGPFYAGARVPTVHHTMGGIQINVDAQVLNVNGDVIPGLYAAGEVTGGIHGTNRLGGNALTDILVFGRIAGESAAESK